MNTETRNCQNCKADFAIEPADFDFYRKMEVPPPTFCPQCRFQRRIMFRNERVLYKRECGLCGKSVVSIFAPEKPYIVYCPACWWSDNWDPGEYCLDYDPDKHFFEQFKELQKKTPWSALIVDYSTLVNSDYVNHAGSLKNCYLTFNADFDENVLYSTLADHSKDSMDMNMIDGSELCYEGINCQKCFKTFFSEDCISCTDVYFSKGLSGCQNCFGCVNLRNKNYHIWNEPYSKEDYEAKLKELRLDTHAGIEKQRAAAPEFWKKFPHRYMRGTHNVNVSGDYVWESKNAHDMYQARAVEDGRYCQFITLKPVKDAYDLTEWGNGAELICDSITVGEGANNIRYCFGSWQTAKNNEYCMIVTGSSDMFGCANIRKKKFCILNKQYSEAEYRELRAKIIKDMNERPYVDSQGREWKYGEFFPYDLSLFAYNESQATQYYPLSEEEALTKGFGWRDPTPPAYEVTLAAEDIPESIHDVDESILKEVLGCTTCGKPYRLVPMELKLLKRFEFPVPRRCADCRHADRIARTNPPRFWARKCDKCGKDVETSFAPDRPETVYCEECYSAEVA
jgi:hypothetical protein